MTTGLAMLDAKLPLLAAQEKLANLPAVFEPLPQTDWARVFEYARTGTCIALDMVEPDFYTALADPDKIDRVVDELRVQCDVQVQSRLAGYAESNATTLLIDDYLAKQADTITATLTQPPSHWDIRVVLHDAMDMAGGNGEIGELHDCITACLYAQQQDRRITGALKQADNKAVDLLIYGRRPLQLSLFTPGLNL